VDNNYLDLGMNKSGFVQTLPSGRLNGSVPHIMVLSLKLASHSMSPKGEALPRQPRRAIATSLPHLPRRLSQEKVSLALIPLVGSSHIEGGVEYGTSFSSSKENKKP
jgi:hypothetical protein